MRLDKLALLRAPGRNRSWFVVSAAIHVAAIAGLLVLFRGRPSRTVTMIDLGDGQEPMPAYRPPAGGTPTGRTPSARPPRTAPMPDAPPVVAAVPLVPVAQDTVKVETPIAEDEDSLPPDLHHRQPGPLYGDGRLWVHAGDAAAGRVPARMAVDSMPVHVAKIDSALAEKIRSYLDTVPPDSFAIRAAPKWTTQIAGKTWGIDGKWIYLGGIKIPTTLLALLPLPPEAAGSFDLAQREAHLNSMRRDIMEAAQRAGDAVEFRKYVKELRERKEAEHRASEVPALPPPVKPDSTRKKPVPVPAPSPPPTT